MTRLLPREEWPRLAETGSGAMASWSALGAVVVVERDGRIVACQGFLPIWHLEGLWIHPDERTSGSVGRRLWRAVQQYARGLGVQAVMTFAISDVVRSMCERLGATKVQAETYVVPMRERSCQRLPH